ncbi:bifunctional acetate--CoA ligase family protein/GNAT family N-acetyltransferase [Myxococcus llanfairpwllgwyngyllgogerychwyrndrobwllllantysiliogogogochensis]|uniref:Bifunctional acetate--CoA ligase family protein/GNAT family N-acetyltransferase n=1 Tax=Myxococcus llanfairpwllgwyngyllgogerychwyrndrobwllllantysiliogogogochensis TaxID=2590453 RepID=A0A540X8T1_9BACT|nr:bifunctional acetate--CoA ligase family protein/GNAT family N-acetyltransferase [Myxococcus llanfairpwllgwyngyllgogerychwyrndrobwllllantysiliogogogochensis]TQF17094.1 bifunctional acetate--CoA ligase family protein/GNAT family N-acetyltransferase [Myxococcus llanfairpwllgwyngyllgogerychwyrndrobwllllantysiliogogogochensis]
MDERATGPRKSDPSYNVLHQQGTRQPLDVIFKPRSVAVVGASERPGSVGRTVLWNLISNPFGGTVYPINPKRPNVLGIRAWPSLRALPEPVDLAVVVTPAPAVPDVIRECAELGVQGAIIISAGFKETGEAGARLEREILQIAQAARMRIIGPNCLGVMRPPTGFNATFAGSMARPGNVAFISQSGALLTAILDWSLRESVGFSAFVSVGSMLDVGWGDLIDYLADDPMTRSILIYMESIGDARAFLSAAREVALTKPIIVIKAGRTAQAAQAAASHTGTLTGSDEVLTAAFRRTGVLRVESISDLFYMAETLAKQPRPAGRRLTVLTNAGGPGVLATDALVSGGGELAVLGDETRKALDGFLPPQWSHGNPVDVLGDADPERYAKALEVAGKDPNSDGLLVILTPQDMTEPTQTADRLKPYAKLSGKPVLASWMGGSEVVAGERILNDAAIPTFGYPDTAARIFNYMWRYSYNLAGLYETPTLAEEPTGGRDAARRLVDAARAQGRTLLTEHESKQLLAAYGIPTVETRLATTEEDAVAQAQALGYPVVLKLHSFTVTHKTDVGGVRLDLPDAEAVRAAFRGIRERLVELGQGEAFDGVTVQPMVKLGGYELIVGSSLDPQFGPVLLFGAGGTLVEVFKDRALGLPPLNTTLARRMMEQTRILQALRGVRGAKPVDLPALERLLVRFGQLVVEQRLVKEVDINPLLASPERLLALDARVVLHPPDVTEAELPRLAIEPYPQQYVSPFKMKSGEELLLRPIRPEDEPKMERFHRTLSEQTVFLRYAGLMQLSTRVAHERLARICFNDYAREMALVAERRGGEILGVGRLTRLRGTRDAEFAILISDEVQHQGLGSEMLRRLVEVGRAWGMQRIVADILAGNRAMQNVSKRLGFSILPHEELAPDMVKAVKVL